MRAILGRDYFSKSNVAAFTLIELLVAVAIVGVLSVSLVFVVNPGAQLAKTRDAQRKNDLEQIKNALDIYYGDYNQYPPSLSALAVDVNGQIYIKKVPQDPLNTQSYCYEVAGDNSMYRLNAKLERSSDPQISPDITCDTKIYNYAVTSTNISVIAYGLPTPTIFIPSVPTSAPTPTPTRTLTPTPIPPTVTPTPTRTPTPTITPTRTPTPIPTPTPTPSPCSSWTQKANFGGTARRGSFGFSIGTKGYIGSGYDDSDKWDFWEFDPSNNLWIEKSSGGQRRNGVGFSIGTKGYSGTGYESTGGMYTFGFQEYNSFTNLWTAKNTFIGWERHGAVGFSIGTKGYVGTGYFAGSYRSDFWEYNPSNNSWTQKANFGGGGRFGGVGFSIGTKGYVGTGSLLGSFRKDFWEFDPSSNSWTQKANFGGTERYLAVGFSIGTKGYVGTGYDGLSAKKDFWEFDPSNNSWTQKANFGGSGRYSAVGFSIGTKGYVGTGWDPAVGDRNDFWECQ